MAHIEAFRGIRFDLGHVGSLSDVVAPPYDVISPEMQADLYKKHPANVIRLILNRDEPGDDASNNRYSRAARFLKNWKGEGVLQQDPDPALYVYHQVFEQDGVVHTRRGFMCRTRLERFGEGRIYPHEETHASAKADRLKLTIACRANLSQIFGIYPEDRAESANAQQVLEDAVADVAPLEATDHLGVIHRLWVVTDVKVIGAVASAMSDKPIFIADGHHRYETACNYRDQLASQQTLSESHPANFVLMMCISMEDPGLIVFPTHRLFRGLPQFTAAELVSRIGECFETKPAGKGSAAARDVWQQIEQLDEQGAIGLFTSKDQQWTLARINDTGRKRMRQVASEHSADWQSLGVSILHRLIIETLLNANELPKAEYVHQVEEVVHGIETGDPNNQSHPYPLVALVMPATVQHIKSISRSWERMPAKSTYFYPKLLSGLVIHPLE